MLNSIQDAVKLILPAKRKTNSTSGWISFMAPCCHHNGESADTRGRGGMILNADGGCSFHCFNCNFKASYVPGRHLTYKFRKLLGWFGASENEIKRLVIDAIRVKDIVSPDAVIEEVEPIDFKPRPLPDEAQDFFTLNTFYTLNDDKDVPQGYHNAVLYISNRLIDFQKYPFYWTPETQYNLHRRVIIPFTWKGNIIGYSARAFDDTVKPKYHSNYEPNYVFNVDKQKHDSKFVIVSEGPFDAMAVDGVAVLSNECSEIQADIIDSLGREVIVVPDGDKSGKKLIDDALEYGWSVSFPIWQKDYKDVSEAVEKLGKLFVIKSILAGKETGRLKIELLKKKLNA
jgi:hypothetical protein